jgi:hypothetical protein
MQARAISRPRRFLFPLTEIPPLLHSVYESVFCKASSHNLSARERSRFVIPFKALAPSRGEIQERVFLLYDPTRELKMALRRDVEDVMVYSALNADKRAVEEEIERLQNGYICEHVRRLRKKKRRIVELIEKLESTSLIKLK